MNTSFLFIKFIIGPFAGYIPQYYVPITHAPRFVLSKIIAGSYEIFRVGGEKKSVSIKSQWVEEFPCHTQNANS